MKIVYAGVRIDSEDDQKARFPESQVEFVRERIRDLLSHVDPSAVIGSAAAGADLIIAEEALKLEIPLHLVIPAGVDRFKEMSVSDRGELWTGRYERVVESCAPDRVYELESPEDDVDSAYFRRMNREIVRHAKHMEPEEVMMGLAILPEHLRGQGSVSDDFAEYVETTGNEVVVVDPSVPEDEMKTVFVAMPFGEKEDPKSGRTISCDRIFNLMIVPALEDADLSWERADERVGSGVIHAAMIESLSDTDIVVADTVTYNENVFYELGLRHVFAESSTLLIGPEDTDLPFDVELIRQTRYPLSEGRVTDQDAIAGMVRIRESLHVIKNSDDGPDSPIYQLFEVDAPRIRVSEEEPEKERYIDLANKVARAHRLSSDELDRVFQEVREAEVSTEASRSLQYRLAVTMLERGNNRGALRRLQDLRMSEQNALYASWLQKKALALQRVGSQLMEEQAVDSTSMESDQYWRRSEELLNELLRRTGDDPETCGIAGGVAKRRSWYALRKGDDRKGRIQLDRARMYYRRGFEADPTNYYTGINLLSLSRVRREHFEDSSEVDLEKLLPVVEYIIRRAVDREGGFWAEASMAELRLNRYLLGDDAVSYEDVVDGYQAAASMRHPPGWNQSVIQSVGYLRTVGDPPDIIEGVLRVFQ